MSSVSDEQLVERGKVGAGTGDNDVGIRAVPAESALRRLFALVIDAIVRVTIGIFDADSHLAEGVYPFRDGIYGVFDEPDRRANYLIDGGVSGVNRPRADGGALLHRAIGPAQPNARSRQADGAAGDLEPIQGIQLARLDHLVRH